MKEMIVGFFEDLYMVDNEVNPHLVLPHVEQKVTQFMNDDLCKDFYEKEISDTMFQMGPLKAPGPDGSRQGFIKSIGAIMKNDVVATTRKFFLERVLSEGINDTAIVLIPKGNDLEELKDFRLISLCNMIYKLVSKCIVNRLRGIHDEIINPKQSAFVPTRRITDNTLIAFECAHEIQRTNGRRGDFCAYKLDLPKAYDHVDWSFLKQVMKKLGFHSKFVQWIMTCVITVHYRVHFNETALSPFRPSRGLHQGDPLSPYLFFSVAGCLSLLVKNYERQRLISGIQVSHYGPSISHLLFADDSILFFKLEENQARHVRDLRAVFEKSTEQKLSPSKCLLPVSEGADNVAVNEVTHILGIERAGFYEKYLGLPMPTGRLKCG
jgi:hypothetical protein